MAGPAMAVPSDLKGLLREALLDVCMTENASGSEAETRQHADFAMQQLKGQAAKGKGEMKGLLKDTLLEIVRPEDILAGIPVPQKGQQQGFGGYGREAPRDEKGAGKGEQRGRKGKGKHDGRNGYEEAKKPSHQEEMRWPTQEDQRWAQMQAPQQAPQEVPWYPSGGVSYPFVIAGDGRPAGAGAEQMAFNPFFPPGVQLAQIPAWPAKGVQVAMPMGQWPAQAQPQQAGLAGLGLPGGGPDPKSYQSLGQHVPAQPQAQPSHQSGKDKPLPKERKQKQNQKGGEPQSAKPRQEPRVRRERVDVEVEPAMDESLRTSVMLRNIPNKYTQRMLLSVVHELGFNQTCFDFFYLPIDFRNKCNVGYAFINFLSNDVARQFFKGLDGYQLRAFNSDKVCAVAWARVQGLQANIEHYRNSPIAGVPIPQYRPLLFDADTGVEIPFPEPDGPLARVRLRVPKGAPAQRKNRFKNNNAGGSKGEA
jgi:hypothetical protein